MRYLLLTLASLLIFLAMASAGFGQKRNAEIWDLSKARSTPTVIEPANGVTDVVFSAPIMSVDPDSTFDAVFTISDVNGLGIITYQMDIHYTAALLQFNGCSTVGTISSGGPLTCNGSVDGLVELVWTTTMPLINDSDGPPSPVFKLNFTAQGNIGDSSPITFTDVQVNEDMVTSSAVPGAITIFDTTSAPITVAGRVLSADNRPVQNAIVTFVAQNGSARSARTNSFGFYRIEGLDTTLTYTANVRAKARTFEPRTVSFVDDVADFNFIAIE